MKRWGWISLTLVVGLGSCGKDENDAALPECATFADADYDEDTGWGSDAYCAAPTDLGCFPYHESAADTCGPFDTMRTSATSQEDADDCRALLQTINCGTFTDSAGTTLGFYVREPEKFAVDVVGTYKDAPVDTTFYFNPCQQSCLSAVTLDTIEADQQKVCDIPRQGKPACQFPGTAHTVTWLRYDAQGMEIRMAGETTGLSRVADE